LKGVTRWSDGAATKRGFEIFQIAISSQVSVFNPFKRRSLRKEDAHAGSNVTRHYPFPQAVAHKSPVPFAPAWLTFHSLVRQDARNPSGIGASADGPIGRNRHCSTKLKRRYDLERRPAAGVRQPGPPTLRFNPSPQHPRLAVWQPEQIWEGVWRHCLRRRHSCPIRGAFGRNGHRNGDGWVADDGGRSVALPLHQLALSPHVPAAALVAGTDRTDRQFMLTGTPSGIQHGAPPAVDARTRTTNPQAHAQMGLDRGFHQLPALRAIRDRLQHGFHHVTIRPAKAHVVPGAAAGLRHRRPTACARCFPAARSWRSRLEGSRGDGIGRRYAGRFGRPRLLLRDAAHRRVSAGVVLDVTGTWEMSSWRWMSATGSGPWDSSACLSIPT